MGATGIEWTKGPNGEPGFTFNPWIGCTKITAACDHCYAETAAIKLDAHWGPHAPRRPVSDSTWNAPRAWNRRARREGKRFRVFCASMADVLDNHHSIDDRWRSWLYELIFDTPHLDWLLLTKRPENAQRFLPAAWFAPGGWPKNVWMGGTAEDQPRYNHMREHLGAIPARVRFLSVEPMLGRIYVQPGDEKIFHWIIAGGESGRLAQIRDTPIVDFAVLAEGAHRLGIPFFMKQLAQISHRGTYKKFETFPPALRIREQPGLAA
jgi:protein gp37